MTLSDIIREVGELSARSERIKSDVKSWVNRGQRAIAQSRNWQFMHSQQNVTMLAGASSANLPVNFKELSAEKSPITYTDPSSSQFPRPVTISSRAELERMAPGFQAYVTNAPAGYGTPYFVFLEQNNGGVWTLNLPQAYPILTNITYVVSCYLFPQDLSAGGDISPITTDAELAEALVNWVCWKAISKEDPTDARAAAFKAIFDEHLRTAKMQDARKPLAGRSMRM